MTRAARLGWTLLAAAAAVLLGMIVTAGGDPYTIQLRMDNAGGLKDGSLVTVGGVRVGEVVVDVDVESDVAVAELEIEDEHAPFGKDAGAAIVARNLLGQKSVQVTPGNTRDPAPSGYAIPTDRITEATDLDRVLSVLDADTRTRLAIFVNEAGTAFTGRKADFSRLLRDLGPAIGDATELVGQLADANEELGRLVEISDRYLAQVNARRDDVVRLVDRVGQAALTGSTKRAELRATLAQSPGALRTARSFLSELRAATVPLGPAARRLSATAGPLSETLAQIDPFRRAATPVLRTATDVAPTLERLAARATPVLRKAVPTARSLNTVAADALPPALDVSDRSLNNTLAVLDNWAGAIQFRDGLSHIFRGEGAFSPDFVVSAIERLAPSADRGRKQRKPEHAARPPAPVPSGPQTAGPKLPEVKLPGLPAIRIPELDKTLRDPVGELDKTVDGLLGGLGSKGSEDLLDYLLGP